jgi:haloacetate dehalogenase
MSKFSGFADFKPGYHRVGTTLDAEVIEIFACHGGSGPPLLMLHGFPQTHATWHRVAQRLAHDFTLVLPDLRGYGDSTKPVDSPEHVNLCKRAMAADMVELMAHLGHERFGVVGHDRGGRVAHRLALDHPGLVDRLMVLDIAPTLDMYETAGFDFGRAYYHWFHLIQPAPLPEKMIESDWRFYLHHKLGGWGGAGGLDHIEPEALAEYERCFEKPDVIHSMCEDYRASAGIDLVHDRVSRDAGVLVQCPMHVLWGERGVIQKLYDPLALWRARCAREVTGHALPAGHYIPEELPDETAAEVRAFFTR